MQKGRSRAERRRHLAGFCGDQKTPDVSARQAGQGQHLPLVKLAVNTQSAPVRGRAVMQERVGDSGERQLPTEQGAQGAGAEDKPGFAHSASAFPGSAGAEMKMYCGTGLNSGRLLFAQRV